MIKMCKNSTLYKFVISDKNIFRAIYSLQHHNFERALLSRSDLDLLSSLEDSFNSELILTTIRDVKKRIEEVLVHDDLFTYKVYFKPKSLSDDGKMVEGRPLHTASYRDQIAIVALLNVLLFKFNINSPNTSDNSRDEVTLSQIAASLPHNFYGNLVSLEPEHLFQPWTKNYRKYLDKITEGYKIYHETEEFIYEASLDLKQFFPSLNPLLLYQDILTKHGALFDGENLECFKRILFKLLFAKVKLAPELKTTYYEDKLTICENLVRGIPQGLPHAYFFGNLGMVEVAEILESKLKDDKGTSVKAYYYVDDSVIFCNLNDENFR